METRVLLLTAIVDLGLIAGCITRVDRQADQLDKQPLTFNTSCPPGGIQVGPGPVSTITRLSEIPWGSVNAGSVICVYPNSGGAPYNEQLHLDRSPAHGSQALADGANGTATNHIVIRGIPVDGIRPKIDAYGATCSDHIANNDPPEEAQGAVVVEGTVPGAPATPNPISYVDIENFEIVGAKGAEGRTGNAQICPVRRSRLPPMRTMRRPFTREPQTTSPYGTACCTETRLAFIPMLIQAT